MKRLAQKLRFGKIKNRFWGKLNSIEEEIELREIARKKIKRTEGLEPKINEEEELKLKTAEYKCSKL